MDISDRDTNTTENVDKSENITKSDVTVNSDKVNVEQTNLDKIVNIVNSSEQITSDQIDKNTGTKSPLPDVQQLSAGDKELNSASHVLTTEELTNDVQELNAVDQERTEISEELPVERLESVEHNDKGDDKGDDKEDDNSLTNTDTIPENTSEITDDFSKKIDLSNDAEQISEEAPQSAVIEDVRPTSPEVTKTKTASDDLFDALKRTLPDNPIRERIQNLEDEKNVIEDETDSINSDLGNNDVDMDNAPDSVPTSEGTDLNKSTEDMDTTTDTAGEGRLNTSSDTIDDSERSSLTTDKSASSTLASSQMINRSEPHSSVPIDGSNRSLYSDRSEIGSGDTTDDTDKRNESMETEESENAFEHVNTENDKDEEKEDDAETTHVHKTEEDPIDCWPLNAEPKDILSICPEDNDECIIPDDDKEKENVKSFSKTETVKEPEGTVMEPTTAAKTPEEQPAPVANEKSYDFSVDVSPTENRCIICFENKTSNYHFTYQNDRKYICGNLCLDKFKENPDISLIAPKTTNTDVSMTVRQCADCKNRVINDINSYSWEALDFCSEACLARYQKHIGSYCQQCQIPVSNSLLGKYCVRFGSSLRQFCSGKCLETHKRLLRVCVYCQEDLSIGRDGCPPLPPIVVDANRFCTIRCMHDYRSMTTDRMPIVPEGTICSVCMNQKKIEITFEYDNKLNMFCGNPCLVAFKFVNNVSPMKCGMCYTYVLRSTLKENTMYYEGKLRSFCSSTCKNIYIIANRKIVPCSWCKVKKYNFDMIRKTSSRSQIFNICSLHCLKFFNTSLSVVSTKSRKSCDYCRKVGKPVYHLPMSDTTMRNFCSNMCVMGFQKLFEKPSSQTTASTGTQAIIKQSAPPVQSLQVLNESLLQQQLQSSKKGGRGRPPRLLSRKQVIPDKPGPLPVITSVRSLAPSATKQTSTNLLDAVQFRKPAEAVPQKPKKLLVVKNFPSVEQRNVQTTAVPIRVEQGTNFTPDLEEKGMQTDDPEEKMILIPIPVPIYLPSPMYAFHAPLPAPIPFALPIPVPVLIPITKHTTENIMKEIKQKVEIKAPADPFEAELLMMAELVAAEKKEAEESDDGGMDTAADEAYSPEPVDSNTFGDDMLQMALKMASDFEEPAVDLEGALTASTITPSQNQHNSMDSEEIDDPGHPMQHHHQGMIERGGMRGRRRGGGGGRQTRAYPSRRGRRPAHQQQMDMAAMQAPPPEPQPPPEPVEKPDAHMCLKYTFGVNAWKQWVTTKNVELERSSRRLKLFKTELLQLTSDELNYSLCLFVKEVRKPNGSEYAPDTIYYLCLGIQQYLFENGRIDNIFCDSYYDKFTEYLDEVCKKFSALYNDSHYIVTRVEEEHLWESKQLGAHSPHVLLSTLMFFNTKHFNLTSVDEHMQLSFSHIMKHWKRNPNQPANATAPKTPGSRNVLLRFYPPQSALEANSRKKKVYEQQENEENPLRCPVKLYEFYLSKCPESVKTRNDVFYLMPERSCVPDSPVWYSTIAQERPALEKMLHRVKMVKEINVALLTT